MAEVKVNAGRAQGGGMFVATKKAVDGLFYFADLTPTDIYPKLGDAIVDPDGVIWKVTERDDTSATCENTGKTFKGETGETPDIEVTATVDETIGTPEVVVTKGGTPENPTFDLAFSGLKGEHEDISNYYTKDEADAKIADAVASEKSEREQAVSAEATTREQAVTEEASAREQADASEARERELADTNLQGQVDAFYGQVENEATTRANADTELEAKIDANKTYSDETYATKTELETEKSERESTESELSKEIADEKTQRESDIFGLDARIKAVEDDYLTSADKTALETSIDAVQSDLNAYKESNDKSIADLESSLTTAVQAEETARENADAELDARLLDEAGERKDADETLQDNIDALAESVESTYATKDALKDATDDIATNKADILTLKTQSGAILKVTEDTKTYEYTFGLYNAEGELLGEEYDINLPMESVVMDGRYDEEDKSIILVLVSGKEIEIPIGDVIDGLAKKTDVDAVSDRVTALEDDHVGQSDIAAINGDIGTINGNISSINSSITSINGDITQLKTDVSNAQGDATQALEDALNAQNTADGAVTKAGENASDIAALQKDVEDLQAEDKTLESGITTAQSAAEKAQETADANASDIATINSDIATINGEINGLKETDADLQEQINGKQASGDYATNEEAQGYASQALEDAKTYVGEQGYQDATDVDSAIKAYDTGTLASEYAAKSLETTVDTLSGEVETNATDIEGLKTGKQDVIGDLEEIRENAETGASQSAENKTAIDTINNTISDYAEVKSNVESALSKANANADDISELQGEVATLETNVQTAQNTADTAEADAQQAISDAASAKSVADTAQSTAESAKSAAETAQSTADDAKATAESADAKADANADDITALKSSVANVENTATEAQAAATEALANANSGIKFSMDENGYVWAEEVILTT